MTVGRRFRCDLAAKHRACTGAVIDYDLRAEPLAETRRDGPCDDIRATRRGRRHNNPDWTRRVSRLGARYVTR
jgi:hypothetical protein